MIQALNSAMDIMMTRDPNVVVLGEDIGYFGGVFRVTDGLQRKYGEHRVLDTPIAEGAIVAAAIGMGVNGLRPGRRGTVRRLHLSRLRPDLQRAGAAALPQRRRILGAGHDTHALRRRYPRWPDAFAEPGGDLHARVRHQGRDALEPLRREGSPDRGDRGRRPGGVLRAEARLQRPVRRQSEQGRRVLERARQGRGSRRVLHHADRPGRYRACGLAGHDRDLRHDGVCLPGRGGGPRPRRGDHRRALDGAARHRYDHGLGQQDRTLRDRARSDALLRLWCRAFRVYPGGVLLEARGAHPAGRRAGTRRTRMPSNGSIFPGRRA